MLVTGGSQGARVMADVVPAALALLDPDERQWIRLTQQARGEDKARVAAACARMSFPVEIAEFFADLPARIAAAHLVIGRAGASTVSELAVIGRPSVLVPFPHALDQDQAANAAALAASGGAIVVPQTEFTPERLAAILRDALAVAGEARSRRRGGEVGRRSGRSRAARRSGVEGGAASIGRARSGANLTPELAPEREAAKARLTLNAARSVSARRKEIKIGRKEMKARHKEMKARHKETKVRHKEMKACCSSINSVVSMTYIKILKQLRR